MTIKKASEKLLFSIYIPVFLIVFSVSVLFYVNPINTMNRLNALCAGFLVVFLLTVLYTIYYHGFMSLYAIWLYTSAFFIYDSYFFTLTGDYNFLQQRLPLTYTVSERAGVLLLMASFLTLFVTHISYCLLKTRVKAKNVAITPNDPFMQKCGMALMIIFLIPVLYKTYLQVRYVMTYGYLAIFTGMLAEISYPIWTFGCSTAFNIGYILFFTSSPSKKSFIVFTSIYTLVAFFSAMKGQRGPILSSMLVLFYLLYKKYNMKIGIKTIVFLAVVVCLITIKLGETRSNYGKDTKAKSSSKPVTEAILGMLWGQTNTKAVPLLIMDRELEYHTYPFVFSPLLTQINSALYPTNGQTVVSAEKYNNISQVTMYNVSRKTHLKGGGYGGAFLAEAYDCGGFFGVIFFSILIAWIMLQFDVRLNYLSRKMLPLAYYVLLNNIALPRGRFFGWWAPTLLFFIYIFYLLVKNARWFTPRSANQLAH